MLHEPPVLLLGEPGLTLASLMAHSPQWPVVQKNDASLSFCLETTPEEVPLPSHNANACFAAVQQVLALLAEAPNASAPTLQSEILCFAPQPIEDMHTLLLAHSLLAV